MQTEQILIPAAMPRPPLAEKVTGVIGKIKDTIVSKGGIEETKLNEIATKFLETIFNKFKGGTTVKIYVCYNSDFDENKNAIIRFEGGFTDFRVKGVSVSGKITANLSVTNGLLGPHINKNTEHDILLEIREKLDRDAREVKIKQKIRDDSGYKIIEVKTDNSASVGDEAESFVTYTENREKIHFARIVFKKKESPLGQINGFPEFKVKETTWYLADIFQMYSCAFPDEKELKKYIRADLWEYYYTEFRKNSRDNVIVLKAFSKPVSIPNFADGDVEAFEGKIKFKIMCKYRLSFFALIGRRENIYEDYWYIECRYDDKWKKLEFIQADKV